MASFKDSALSAMRIAICTQVDVCCPSRFSRQRVYFSFTFSGVFCLIHVASSSIVNQTPLKWPSPRITPTTTRTERTTGTASTVQRSSALNRGRESTRSFFETCDSPARETRPVKSWFRWSRLCASRKNRRLVYFSFDTPFPK